MRKGRPARSSGPGPGLGMLCGGTVTLCLQTTCGRVSGTDTRLLNCGSYRTILP